MNQAPDISLTNEIQKQTERFRNLLSSHRTFSSRNWFSIANVIINHSNPIAALAGLNAAFDEHGERYRYDRGGCHLQLMSLYDYHETCPPSIVLSLILSGHLYDGIAGYHLSKLIRSSELSFSQILASDMHPDIKVVCLKALSR